MNSIWEGPGVISPKHGSASSGRLLTEQAAQSKDMAALVDLTVCHEFAHWNKIPAFGYGDVRGWGEEVWGLSHLGWLRGANNHIGDIPPPPTHPPPSSQSLAALLVVFILHATNILKSFALFFLLFSLWLHSLQILTDSCNLKLKQLEENPDTHNRLVSKCKLGSLSSLSPFFIFYFF